MKCGTNQTVRTRGWETWTPWSKWFVKDPRFSRKLIPTVEIVSPSHPLGKGTAWLNEFLTKGGGQYVDVIGYHFYVQQGTPEAMVPIIQQVKAVMD